MAMARHQDSLYEATLRGGGDISEDTRTLLSEKCDLVKSYLAPEKSMAGRRGAGCIYLRPTDRPTDRPTYRPNDPALCCAASQILTRWL
jgi:hypothetical protein